MTYDCFRAVLSALDDEGRHMHGKNWEPKVAHALAYLEKSYANLRDTSRPLIDYGTPQTQTAYMFIYAVGRAEFTYQIFRAYRDAIGRALFDKKNVRIAAIGGGPASELPGIAKYLSDVDAEEPVESLQFDVYDKELTWQPVGELLATSIDSSIVRKPRYFPLDLSDTAACSSVDLSKYDAVILSFVISEICCLPDSWTIRKNLAAVLNTMRTGSFAIYNDSNAFSFYSFMNSVRKATEGLNELYEIDAIIEIKSPDFSGIFEKMILRYDRTPHLKSKAISKYFLKN